MANPVVVQLDLPGNEFIIFDPNGEHQGASVVAETEIIQEPLDSYVVNGFLTLDEGTF